MEQNKKTFHILYWIAFLISFAYSLPLYVQSSFLEQYTSAQYVGLYITIATAFTLLAIYIFPQFIKKYTNFKTMLWILAAHIMSSVCLVLAAHPLWALVFFVGHFVTITLLGINLDVFLEDITDEPHTGRIRATFLTIVNLAILFGPVSMGTIVTATGGYAAVYLIAASILTCVFFIILFFKRQLNDQVAYRRRNLLELILVLRSNTNLSRIFILSFALRFFFSIMVLYTPLYLHDHIGFSWGTIGVIFTIMLTPFVFLELPAGNLADKYLGEKEMMIIGLIIMGLATGAIYFISSTDALIWTGTLFMTRIGASLLEAMHEIYFFKIIKREDVDLINLFRDTHPAGWLMGSLLAVVIYRLFSIETIFLVLGIILLACIYPAARLKDTR